MSLLLWEQEQAHSKRENYDYIIIIHDNGEFVKEKYMYSKIEIYQLKAADHNRAVRFQSLANYTAEKGAPSAADYDRVYEYTALRIPGSDTETVLEHVFRTFNIHKPRDFKGHSLSVSDVVTLDGTAYYVDSFGFKKIEGFFKEKNYAKIGRKINHISGGIKNDSNTHT